MFTLPYQYLSGETYEKLKNLENPVSEMRSKRGTSRISNGSADHYTYFKIIIQKV
jgi:hypothetical protein